MAVVTALIVAMTAVTMLTPIGCAATTKAAGPAAAATHETRRETAGVTRERRVEVRVKPGQGTEAPRQQGTEDSIPGSLDASMPSAVEGACGRGGERGGIATAPAPLAALLVMAAVGQVGPPADDLDAVLRAAVELAKSQGVEVEIVIDDYEHRPLAADTTRSTIDEAPASLATSSREAALGFTTTLRRFRLPWGGEAEGGGFGFEATILGGRGVNVLHLVGAAVMCLAVIPLLRTPRRWGSAAVFGGAGLAIVFTGTLVDKYPWITLLAAVLLLGLLGYGAYEAWRRGRVGAALDAITPVIEKHPMGEQLKGLIGDRAGRLKNAVKAETTASKARA